MIDSSHQSVSHLFFDPSLEKLLIRDAARIAAADDGVLLLNGGGGEELSEARPCHCVENPDSVDSTEECVPQE
jgi:hypothetical protein